VYISSRANETEYVSDGTTYRVGAMGREECVPKTAQLGIDIGTKFFDETTLLTTVTSATPAGNTAVWVDNCLTAACSTNQCCFAQFDYAWKKNNGAPGTPTCRAVNMAVNTNAAAHTLTTSKLLFYKMLPSDAIAAASVNKTGKVEAKAMSSGLYARCDLPSTPDWSAPGTYNNDKTGRQINSSGAPCNSGCARPAGTAAGLADCKKKCDMLSVCWGFTVVNSQCQLRGGFDEMDVRSFFRNPTNPTTFNW
jgi:hypothetical protein